MKSIYRIKNGLKRRLFFINRSKFKMLGKKSVILSPICVEGKKFISLDDYVRISEFSRIEAISSWNEKKFKPNLSIGEHTTFEQFAHITFASNLTIGSHCTFLSRVLVTTIDHLFLDVSKSILKNDITTKDVKIGNYCFFGMDSKIFPGVEIGDHVIVGANSIVMNDLPSFTVCVGVPAKPIKKYNFETGRREKYGC